MKEVKERQHKLSDRNPAVSAVLFGIVGFVIVQALLVIINSIIALIIPVYPSGTGPVGVIISTALLLWWFKRWFGPDYLGSIKGGEYSNVWILVIVYAVYLVATFITDRIFSGTKAALPAFNNVLMSFVAGVTEEAAFRGLMVPVLMRKNSKKSLMLPVFLPAIVFALVHGSNMIFGAALSSTIEQVISCIFFGTAYTVIYLVSGNILIPMAIHLVHDLIAFAHAEADVVLTGGVHLDGVISTALAGIMFAIVMYYITRPKNTEKVWQLWDRKWNR